MAEIWYYIDTNGMFGTPGELITDKDLIEYWNENYAEDPVLSGYTNFTDWYRETRRFLKKLN